VNKPNPPGETRKGEERASTCTPNDLGILDHCSLQCGTCVMVPLFDFLDWIPMTNGCACSSVTVGRAPTSSPSDVS
jgi:hypothetical protein